jgi:hypothetical protein
VEAGEGGKTGWWSFLVLLVAGLAPTFSAPQTAMRGGGLTPPPRERNIQ